MASTSASSIQKRFKYDVFISFRGEDTRKNFVDNLYHALEQKGIYTYKDDKEIKKGKTISDELIKSIEDSKFIIIVFSKNYASSSWCLNELVKIMECQKTNEQVVFPVFYDVEPTEVRNQSGAVGEAFAKHVNKEAAKRWRDAMKEAASLAGWELKNTFDGHEAKFIQKIVGDLSQKLRCIDYSVDEKLVGMETRVRGVVSSLEADIYDVRMLGIKGMGGAGKTTLARGVFDQISFQFEGSSFVENEKNILKQRMRGRKVLIVLDDVDHIDQLEALVGEPSWFKPGSRVIITTRDEQVLVAHGVPMNMILNVNLLSHVEANCLLSWYAFGKEIPTQGYKELSDQVVRYAAGLPLTIKVLGSFLRGKDELEWTDALERLKKIPLREIMKKLELSYYGLEEDYREIFLDVACILKGWEKERAIRALESCDLHARIGLRVLEQKSLVTVSKTGCLSMHDQLVEMGKNIVRRLYPNVPYKHSRLWIKEEIEDTFVEDKGTEAIKCMKVDMLDPILIMKGLRKMKELVFLEVIGSSISCFCRSIDSNNIDEDSLHLPNSLRYLCWHGYPFTSLPNKFLANNLVGLEMRYSKVDQLWKGGENKVLKKLRFIDLCFCKLRTLDIGLTMNLERLHLEDCWKLVKLHVPIESFKLKFLSISHCKLIRTLDLKLAQNLETLKVEGCKKLVELHMPVENPKLKHLTLQYSKLKTLNLRPTQNLETIDFVRCFDLVELDMPAKHFELKSVNFYGSKLRTMDLGWVENLDKLNIEEHEELEELHLGVVKIKHICICGCFELKTINLTWIQNLEILNLSFCWNLVELHMPIESLDLRNINIRYSRLRTLNLTQTRNLEKLHLSECDYLLELHMPIESPKLTTVVIKCSKIRTLYLGLSPYLQYIDLKDCCNLVEILAPVGCQSGSFVNQGLPMYGSLAELHLTAGSLGICPLHPDNNFPKFRFECVYNGLQLPFTQDLVKVISLGLCACTNLASLLKTICGLQFRKLTLEGNIPEVHKELDQIESLEELSLLSAEIEHFPDGIFMLKHLKFLKFESCPFLKRLPDDIGRLEYLEELHLTDCKSLKDIPNSICEMKRLKFLHLTNCILVEKLPKEIGRLKCLKELSIKGTSIIDFPSSIDQLEDLTVILDGA